VCGSELELAHEYVKVSAVLEIKVKIQNTAGVSNSRTARLYYAARGHNCKLCIIIIIIGIQPLGRFGQIPELSQATGIALVRCILGKFLGVGCHYFPPKLCIHYKNYAVKHRRLV
jgi:hypothetical protein